MARKPLKDDEGLLASWGQMTAAEKARVRKRENDALDEASSERSRPISSRIADKLYDIGATTAVAKARAKEAQEDIRRRDIIYQDAKKKASQSDKDRDNKRYGVDRPVKTKDLSFARGGTTAATKAKAKAVPKKAAPAKAVPKKVVTQKGVAAKAKPMAYAKGGMATKKKKKGY